MAQVTVGIDFGTSKSVIAFHNGNSVDVISGPNKERAMPSAVAFATNGERLVGRRALLEGKDHPEFCLRHCKRLICDPYLDGEDNGWQSVKGPDGLIWLRGPDRDYSVPEIASYIIKELLTYAQFRLRLSAPPDGAVITHPAHYNDEQKSALIKAAKLAGLDRVHLLEEPVAAAVAYGLPLDRIRHIAAFDMGAGTTDFAILHGGKTGQKTFLEVKGKPGAMPKGGIDADYEIVDWLLQQWYQKFGTDLAQDGAALSRLREAAETAKIALSNNPSTLVSLPLIEFAPPRSLEETLEVTKFNELIKPIIDEAMALCQRTLDASGLTKGNIAEWILVGGMTNVPAVRAALKAFAGKELNADIDPDEVVAVGAATHAAAMIDKRIKPYNLVNKVAHDFGFEASGDVFHKVIKAGDRYPVEVDIPIMSEADDQPELSIHVLEGEPFAASGATRLAAADLPVSPAPKGDARTVLTFRVDDNGMKSVSHPGGMIYEGGANG